MFRTRLKSVNVVFICQPPHFHISCIEGKCSKEQDNNFEIKWREYTVCHVIEVAVAQQLTNSCSFIIRGLPFGKVDT